MDRILIVDDEEAREPRAENLRQEGYEVTTAENKTKALKIISEEDPFDVAIVDMRLSQTSPDVKEKLEGLEVVEALREKDFFTRIIVLTGYGDMKNVYEAMRFGLSQYIHRVEIENINEIVPEAVKKAIKEREFLIEKFSKRGEIPREELRKERLKKREEQLLEGLRKEEGLISEDKIKEALEEQKKEGGRLEDILIKKKFVEEGAINWVLSKELDVPYVYLTLGAIDLELAKSIPEETLREYCMIPVAKIENEITLIMADPNDKQAIEEIRKKTGCGTNIFLGSTGNITEIINRVFGKVVIRGEKELTGEI